MVEDGEVTCDQISSLLAIAAVDSATGFGDRAGVCAFLPAELGLEWWRMEAFDSAGVTGIVWRRVEPAREAEAEALMRELMMLSRASTGYLGSEIFPPITGVQDAYVVLYRFNSGENLRGWLEEARRAAVFEKLNPLLLEPPVEFFFAHRRRAPGTVSTVFSYRLRPDRTREFHDWRRRIGEVSRTWEGFLGVESFDTLDSAQPEFIVVLRFDSRPHLDAWLNSEVRAELMQEVPAYVEDYQVRRIGTGFEGWFDYSPQDKPPVPWRQAMAVLTVLFPVITVLRHLLNPLFVIWPAPVAFLFLLVIDITILTYVIMPRFSRMMAFWLRPGPSVSWRSECAGWAVLLGIIGITLALALRFG